jgi:hypothetical protein
MSGILYSWCMTYVASVQLLYPGWPPFQLAGKFSFKVSLVSRLPLSPMIMKQLLPLSMSPSLRLCMLSRLLNMSNLQAVFLCTPVLNQNVH